MHLRKSDQMFVRTIGWDYFLIFLVHTSTPSQSVHSQSELMQKCSLLTLQHVIKTLAGRRLVNLRKVFYEITTNLFVYIVGLWTHHLQESITRIPSGSAESAVKSLEMTHICLKSV